MEAEKAVAEKALYSATPGAATQVRQYKQVESWTQEIDTATERWLKLAEIELARERSRSRLWLTFES